MPRIAGASGYLNAATLANLRGIPAGQANLLGDGGAGATDLLDVGRRNGVNGIGLSRNARALNKQFLSSSSTTFNQIFSLGLGATATIEGLQQQIKALSSKTHASRLTPEVRKIVEAADTGNISVSENGRAFDAEV